MSDSGPSEAVQSATARPRKSAAAFRTIGEAAEELDVPAHVLRFWETKFPQLKPVKRSGGRRYYRPEDIVLLRRIRHWLYRDGYTIRGVQQLLGNPAPRVAASGAAPEESAGPLAGVEPGTDPEADFALPPDPDPTDPAHAPAPPGPDPKPGLHDPAIRAELEEIGRELRQARALLDDLLQRSKPA